MLHTGTFERSLDAKLRFALPKKARAALDPEITLYLTPGTDQCLELHTPESLAALAQEANAAGARTQRARSFARLFYSQAESLEMDGQGRVRIPPKLAERAALEKNIAVVGVGQHWEIWPLERWNAYCQSHQDEFDSLHATTFDPEGEPLTPNAVPTEPTNAVSKGASRRPK